MDQKIYTVRELSHALRNTLESRFRAIRVEGELSGISAPSSGHLYFSLKEGNALIRCAWFRNRQKRGAIVPEEGMQVIADGQISVYESRGDLQLIVTDMQVSGEGALKLAFERLKRKLQAEGLFEPDTKRPLPAFPKTVGLLTSPGGAVLHDMLVTMNRRFPMVRVILYPVPVQGDSAPPEIARMLDIA
ncbi:MAG: exodeoxyribonuclease VII large subunit [Gammaproteobacteria bacterium]|nr:exodeoxyribonuclease VII large subunit [Gammaproteobacteria bacterium]